MYDVYLGGQTTEEWREKFKDQISSDISIFDPLCKEFNTSDINEKSEQIAREFYFMEQCNLLIFYLNTIELSKSSRLQIGDAVGHELQVIVCLDGDVEGAEYIRKYCEYRGVVTTNSIEDLVLTVEEYAAELAELESFSLDEDD